MNDELYSTSKPAYPGFGNELEKPLPTQLYTGTAHAPRVMGIRTGVAIKMHLLLWQGT